MRSIIQTYRDTTRNTILTMDFGSVCNVRILFLCIVMGVGIFMPQVSQGQVTLSGTLYTDAGVTVQATSKSVKVAVGTSTPGIFASTSVSGSGDWTITIPLGHGIGTGTPLMVWVDDDVTMRATVVTKASSSDVVQNITGLNLYQNRVIVRHEATSGTSTTNSDLGFYTSAQDADLQHSTTTAGITVHAGNELLVWNGDTFSPGGSLMVAGNAGGSSVDGSLFIDTDSTFILGGSLTLGGSLRAGSNVTYTPGNYVTYFVATTTGKEITAPTDSLGRLTFNGVGGGWTFTQAATTSDLTILRGSVTAPATTLNMTGTFQNDAVFNHNDGTVQLVGASTVALSDIFTYAVGRDSSGNTGGTGNIAINAMARSGNYLYVAKAANNTGCSQTAGSANGCELMVFNISNPLSPTYVAGRDALGNATGTGNLAISYLLVEGNYLYAAKAANATACSQAPGFALGCELMVFDISSTTDPTYVAGRDVDGTATGVGTISATSLAVKGNSLYLSKAAAGTTNCSTTASNCELMIFDISTPTNPTYVVGRDTSASAAGTQTLAINSITVNGNYLIAVKGGSATACSQTAGSAVGCEILVFDISSTTNPVYVAGRDVSGSAAGGGNLSIAFVTTSDNTIYVGKAGSVTACSQTAGSAIGCELMAFDFSSTTNPIYRAGLDVGGSETGLQTLNVTSLAIADNYLYVTTGANAVECDALVGSELGCEISVLDISSSSAMRLLTSRDAGGNETGVQSLAATFILPIEGYVIVAKAGVNTACTQVAGTAVGCEIMFFDTSRRSQGRILESQTATSSFSSVRTSGVVMIDNDIALENLSIDSGTTTVNGTVTITGDFDNDAVFTSNQSTVSFSGNSPQIISGNMIGNNAFYNLQFSGTGIKTIVNQASTSFLTVASGGNVETSGDLSVTHSYINDGQLTHTNNMLFIEGIINEHQAGIGSGGSVTDTSAISILRMARQGNYLYVIKSGSGTACSQVAGSAVGCELMVFDISSSTNPVYVAGRDNGGQAGGSSSVNGFGIHASGSFLIVLKNGSSAPCVQPPSSASGCEIMIFDISSSTNPILRSAIDSAGSMTGATTEEVRRAVLKGNYIYAVKSGSIAACSQIAGSATGCDLLVIDISSTTNPVYVAGRDASGSDSGATSLISTSIVIKDDFLFMGRNGNATACSQVAGSAVGCELVVFDISSSTNPVYIAGRDISGNATGTGNVNISEIGIKGSMLYVTKSGSATACSQVAGSAVGCELMVFDISSSTNPVYVAGRDVTGNSTGTGNLAINTFVATTSMLYVVKAGSVSACSQTAGSAIGCELMAFDISSTTNPVYVAGRDSNTSKDGISTISINAIEVTAGQIILSKTGDATICESQNRTLRRGCELTFLQIPTFVSGNLTGSSSLSGLHVAGQVTLPTNASSTDVIIEPNAVFAAPSNTFDISGDLTQGGIMNPGTGTVRLTGNDQFINLGSQATFYNFTQIATGPATTTIGTAGPVPITNSLVLQGTTTNRLKLRALNPGFQWDLLPLGLVSTSYLDVKDARNSSTTPIDCSTVCFDRGNNTNWVFIPTVFGAGSSTLASHTGGQVTDAFDSPSATNESLFAFRLTSETGDSTVEMVRLRLSGVAKIESNTFSNVRLVIDRNSNLQYDGGDTVVDTMGDVFIEDTIGDLVLAQPFVSSTSLDYLVIADWSSLQNGSFVNLSLERTDLNIEDLSGKHSITGSVASVQHSRNNRGGGGGNASIGDPAPPGDGDVGGGETGGGELIGNDPDFFWPSSNSGGWSNGGFAYDDTDGTYATTNGANNHSYSDHGFSIPGGNVISGIVVKLEVSGSTAAGTVDVELSWDGGGSWTTIKSSPTLTTADAVRTLGSQSDLWGRTWTATELTNPNFAVRVTGNPSSNTISLDAIQVRVYHTAGGGGSGGGGGI